MQLHTYVVTAFGHIAGTVTVKIMTYFSELYLYLLFNDMLYEPKILKFVFKVR